MPDVARRNFFLQPDRRRQLPDATIPFAPTGNLNFPRPRCGNPSFHFMGGDMPVVCKVCDTGQILSLNGSVRSPSDARLPDWPLKLARRAADHQAVCLNGNPNTAFRSLRFNALAQTALRASR